MSVLKRFILFIFSAGFFILPFIFWPNVPSKEVSRVIFFQIITTILFVISLISFLINKKKIKINRFFIVIFIFLIIALISSIFGYDFKKSLTGNYYRQDGLITLFFLVVFSVVTYLFFDIKKKNAFILSTTCSSSISSLIFIINKISAKQLAFFSFGNQILLSGYLLITFPFMFYLFKKRVNLKSRIFLALIMFLQITAICLTGSLGGIIGVAIFFLLQIIELHKKNKKFLITIVTVFLITITILVLNIKFKNKNQFVAESRQRIFTKLILGWTKKPILGYGWSNVDYAFEAVPWPLVLTHDVYVDKAHSTLLEILVTTGVFGLIVYLSALVFPIKLLSGKLKGKKDKIWWQTIAFIFILYLFHSQTNVISIAEEMIFWFSVGVALI